jgi:hypothetical protein
MSLLPSVPNASLLTFVAAPASRKLGLGPATVNVNIFRLRMIKELPVCNKPTLLRYKQMMHCFTKLNIFLIIQENLCTLPIKRNFVSGGSAEKKYHHIPTCNKEFYICKT